MQWSKLDRFRARSFYSRCNSVCRAYLDGGKTGTPSPGWRGFLLKADTGRGANDEILFHNGLCGREFGSAVLGVPQLLEWAASKGYGLRAEPHIQDYDYVQVENLLCAIERSLSRETPETAEALIKCDPSLKPDFSELAAAMEPEAAEACLNVMDEAPVWNVGASTHLEWRKILSAAFEAGELQPLKYNSLTPIAPAKQPAPAPKVKAKPVTTRAPIMQGNKLRRNNLDPAIDKAIEQAGNMELADVYLKLKELALGEEKPFTGLMINDALCYTDDNNEPARLSKNALGKRLKNRRLLPLAAVSGR